MADIDHPTFSGHQGEAPEQQGNSAVSAINILGAAASLALMAGIGVWGFKLVMRDVSGVPVVRAIEGPMRVQPENPGGQLADHQGLAVNAVAANGSAAAPADRLVLAPRPVGLTDEDTPPAGGGGGQKTRRTRAVAVPDDTGDQADDENVDQLVRQLLAEAEDPPTPADRSGAKTVMVSARIEQPEPLTPGLDAGAAGTSDKPNETQTVIQPETDPEPEPAVLEGPGLKRSLRPPVRPTLASLTNTAAKPLDVDPDTLAVGTRLAQLGAYESAEIAQREWGRISGRFQDYFRDKSRVIQKASRGGRSFYRLRVMGFDDLADARRFCAVLEAEHAECIPVVTR